MMAALIKSLVGFLLAYMLNDLLPHVTIDKEWTWFGVGGDEHLQTWKWLIWALMWLEGASVVVNLVGVLAKAAKIEPFARSR